MNSEVFLAETREICLGMPGATERLSHGQPAWFVADKKQFAVYLDHHHGDHLPRLWCAAPAGAMAALVDENSARFFKPPYVGTRGWLGVYLREPEDWVEVSSLLEVAYRVVAPRKLLAELDRRTGPVAQDAGQK